MFSERHGKMLRLRTFVSFPTLFPLKCSQQCDILGICDGDSDTVSFRPLQFIRINVNGLFIETGTSLEELVVCQSESYGFMSFSVDPHSKDVGTPDMEKCEDLIKSLNHICDYYEWKISVSYWLENQVEGGLIYLVSTSPALFPAVTAASKASLASSCLSTSDFHVLFPMVLWMA